MPNSNCYDNKITSRVPSRLLWVLTECKSYRDTHQMRISLGCTCKHRCWNIDEASWAEPKWKNDLNPHLDGCWFSSCSCKAYPWDRKYDGMGRGWMIFFDHVYCQTWNTKTVLEKIRTVHFKNRTYYKCSRGEDKILTHQHKYTNFFL